MNITHLQIEAVGGIRSLALTFDPSMNIICGPNGIGKTTILECLAHGFAFGHSVILKRHAQYEHGVVRASAVVDGGTQTSDVRIEHFAPEQPQGMGGLHDLAPFVIVLKTARTLTYAQLPAISRDPNKSGHALWDEVKSGVTLGDVKNWFVSRHLFSHLEKAVSPEKIDNLALAKRCFSILNPSFAFSHVDSSTYEIILSTPQGDIIYEYLSSGFKATLSILFAIIKEVEFRFPDRQMRAADFDGVVLIDELELHLHPEWQYRIARILRETFPRVQFITTSHSPHIIQSAERSQIVALQESGGAVSRRELPLSPYGFKGWTLDEVLSDVMGMQDTRTAEFHSLMDAFTSAVDAEDRAVAEAAYAALDASLHPRNDIRKLLSLQLAAVPEKAHDPT